ncbi:MAG: type II secretion system F family protein [Sulfuriferula sp.]
MNYFRYDAVNQQGRRQRGILAAAHEADLGQRLAGLGLDLITARVVRPHRNNQLTRRELIGLFIHLAHTSRAGIALLDGLRDLRDSVDEMALRDVLTTLLADMEAGRTLSAAMSAQPKIFDSLMLSLVRAGEATGVLAPIFTHLADSLKRLDELRAQTQSLLLYPTLVLILVGAVVVMLLLFLVPQIAQLMHGMGMAIPVGTQVMLVLSAAIKTYWWLLLAILTVSVGGVLTLHQRHAPFRFWCDGWTLRLPVLGAILQKVDLARFADFFALMYQSGIPIFDALALSADLVSNRVLAAAIRRARTAIINGERLSVAFAREQVFPPLVLSMLRIGETTGALDGALLEVRYFYQRDVHEATARALKLLEPMLTLVLGAVLAAIIGMVLLPLYDVLGTVKL